MDPHESPTQPTSNRGSNNPEAASDEASTRTETGMVSVEEPNQGVQQEPPSPDLSQEEDLPLTQAPDPPSRPFSNQGFSPYVAGLRNENKKLRTDYEMRTNEYFRLQSLYSETISRNTTTISALRRQVATLENVNSNLRQELGSNLQRPPRITLADIRASQVFKDLKADLTNKAKEEKTKAENVTKDKAKVSKQVDRLNEQIKAIKAIAREAQKELTNQKKETAAVQKSLRVAESETRKVRDQLSKTRVDLMGSMRAKREADESIKTINKALATTEKQKAEFKKDLEKALQSKEMKAAEAAQAALHKEQLSLEKEKIKCEARLHTRVVEMELDRKKKESLMVAKANISDGREANREVRQRGRRDRRVEDSSDRLYSSIQAADRAYQTQNPQPQQPGHFPLLNSPEAARLGSLFGGRPAQPDHTIQNLTDLVTNVVSGVMASASRGRDPYREDIVAQDPRTGHYSNEALPPGVQLVRDIQTGQLAYRVPPVRGGECRYLDNRDDLFSKQPAVDRSFLDPRPRPSPYEEHIRSPYFYSGGRRLAYDEPIPPLGEQAPEFQLTGHASHASDTTNQSVLTDDLDGDHRRAYKRSKTASPDDSKNDGPPSNSSNNNEDSTDGQSA